MADLLYAAGPARGTGFGLAPIAWSDLEAWLRVSGIRLPPWLATGLVRMSNAYAAQWSNAKDEPTPPPYESDEKRETRQASDIEAFKSFLRSAAK